MRLDAAQQDQQPMVPLIQTEQAVSIVEHTIAIPRKTNISTMIASFSPAIEYLVSNAWQRIAPAILLPEQ